MKLHALPTVSASVPDGAFVDDMMLTVQTRGEHVETVHRGTLAIVDRDARLLLMGGDPQQGTFMRSSAKPFQAMALILTGAAGALNLTDRDIAIACSSHSGQPEHVAAVTQLLEKGDVSPSALRCGIHPPLDAGASERLQADGDLPTALHNNCSGKHAGMLLACRHMGWPIESYQDKNHPLQKLNLQTLSTFTGEERQKIGLAVDGCGVPVFYVSIRSVAMAFSRLATGFDIPPEYSEAAERIRAAMTNNPFLVAGTKRFDTQLMELGKGTIVCKGGAQGGEGIGILQSGIGIALKISDGSSGSIAMVAAAILDRIAGVDDEVRAGLTQYVKQPIRNHAGTLVGETYVTFSIDTPIS